MVAHHVAVGARWIARATCGYAQLCRAHRSPRSPNQVYRSSPSYIRRGGRLAPSRDFKRPTLEPIVRRGGPPLRAPLLGWPSVLRAPVRLWPLAGRPRLLSGPTSPRVDDVSLGAVPRGPPRPRFGLRIFAFATNPRASHDLGIFNFFFLLLFSRLPTLDFGALGSLRTWRFRGSDLEIFRLLT